MFLVLQFRFNISKKVRRLLQTVELRCVYNRGAVFGSSFAENSTEYALNIRILLICPIHDRNHTIWPNIIRILGTTMIYLYIYPQNNSGSNSFTYLEKKEIIQVHHVAEVSHFLNIPKTKLYFRLCNRRVHVMGLSCMICMCFRCWSSIFK